MLIILQVPKAKCELMYARKQSVVTSASSFYDQSSVGKNIGGFLTHKGFMRPGLTRCNTASDLQHFDNLHSPIHKLWQSSVVQGPSAGTNEHCTRPKRRHKGALYKAQAEAPSSIVQGPSEGAIEHCTRPKRRHPTKSSIVQGPSAGTIERCTRPKRGTIEHCLRPKRRHNRALYKAQAEAP